MIYVGTRVRTLSPVTVWVQAETVLSGEYVVERVRGSDVKIGGVWVPVSVVVDFDRTINRVEVLW